MPLNTPKNYTFIPKPVGHVKLLTRSSTRARLTAGGTYFRSKEYGEQANLVFLEVVEDKHGSTNGSNWEGLLVEQHTVFKPEEMVAVTGMPMPVHSLFDLNLHWNEEIRFMKVADQIVAQRWQPRWQMAGPLPSETLLADYGPVSKSIFTVAGVVTLKLDLTAAWPPGAVFYLRPRTHRYTLVPLEVTDPDTMLVTTGWDIGALRSTLNGSAQAWIRMPVRGTAADPETPGSMPTPGEDARDGGTDADFLTPFARTPFGGGDGLPLTPNGVNTGPNRALVHLNYAEKEDGSMGELNAVFEWVGDSASVGSWQRYT